jgi:hypothetical protein
MSSEFIEELKYQQLPKAAFKLADRDFGSTNNTNFKYVVGWGSLTKMQPSTSRQSLASLFPLISTIFAALKAGFVSSQLIPYHFAFQRF